MSGYSPRTNPCQAVILLSLPKNKELTEEKERVSGELAAIESDRGKLTAEKKACEEEAETAKRETEVAKREAADAKAERDRQKK